MFTDLRATYIHNGIIACRTLSVLVVGLLPLQSFSETRVNPYPQRSHTTMTLTVKQTIQYALKNPHFLALVKGRIDAAKGRYTESIAWKDPTISYSEASNDNSTTESNEKTFVLSQTFDISGKKRLNRQAAKLLLEASIKKTSLLRSRTIAYASRLFYNALYQKRRIQVIQRALAQISGLETAIRVREKAGDVSGYHRKRSSKEKYLVRANLNDARSQYQNALNNLSALIRYSNSRTGSVTQVVGILAPTNPVSLDQLLNRLIRRPDLVALKQQAKSEHLNGQAQKRAIIPPITLGLGYKRVDESNQSLSTGPVVSVSIAVPLSSRRRGRQQKHFANAKAFESQYKLRLNKDQGRTHGLWLLLRSQIVGANSFKRSALSEGRGMVRIAKRSYLSGSFGILELIDAQRSALEVEIKYIDLLYKAQRTHLKLNTLVGLQ